jgi:ATP-dependent RNA helicase DDX46/PRP5
MIDLLTANSGRVTNLKCVTYVVLNEADHMFDMGFKLQVTKIISNIRPDCQTVLPYFQSRWTHSPKESSASHSRSLLVDIVAVEIEHIIGVHTENMKFNRLLERSDAQ